MAFLDKGVRLQRMNIQNLSMHIKYPFDQMMIDIKLLFINIWIEYLGFTVGSLDGYKDPAQQKAKDNWKEMITRNMQTIHYSGCLETFEDFIAGLKLD